MASSQARRRSFSEFPETCPEVDRITEACVREMYEDAAHDLRQTLSGLANSIGEDIKRKVTAVFRQSHIEMCAKIEELEGKVEDLERRCRDAENDKEQLENEVRDMESQINELQDQLTNDERDDDEPRDPS